MPKSKFSPSAYIFMVAVQPRYTQTYANTFYEELDVKDALTDSMEKTSPSLHDAAVSLWHAGLCKGSDQIFAIYQPSVKRLQLAAIADSSRPIVLIDTRAKEVLLRRYRAAFELIGMYRTRLSGLEPIRRSIRLPSASKTRNIDQLRKRLQFEERELSENINLMMELVLRQFRQDLFL